MFYSSSSRPGDANLSESISSSNLLPNHPRRLFPPDTRLYDVSDGVAPPPITTGQSQRGTTKSGRSRILLREANRYRGSCQGEAIAAPEASKSSSRSDLRARRSTVPRGLAGRRGYHRTMVPVPGRGRFNVNVLWCGMVATKKSELGMLRTAVALSQGELLEDHLPMGIRAQTGRLAEVE